MLTILKLLRTNSFVKEFVVVDFIEDKIPQYYFYLKIIVTLTDASTLHIKEYRSADERNYSYHWQKNENLIIRWDNAPHHKDLANFPHHKHDPNPSPSSEIEIHEVFSYISKILKK